MVVVVVVVLFIITNMTSTTINISVIATASAMLGLSRVVLFSHGRLSLADFQCCMLFMLSCVFLLSLTKTQHLFVQQQLIARFSFQLLVQCSYSIISKHESMGTSGRNYRMGSIISTGGKT